MGTITLSAERTITAPVEHAWAVLGDYRRDAEWRTGVSSMTIDQHPPVAGSETVELLRFGGRTYHNVGRLTAVTPTAIEWHTVEGAHAQGRRSLESAGDGTCIARLELVVTPRGPERLLAPVLRRLLRRNLHADLDRLAELVASEASVATQEVATH